MCFQIGTNLIVLIPRIGLFGFDVFLSNKLMPQAMLIPKKDDQLNFLQPVDSESRLSEMNGEGMEAYIKQIKTY
jgi:hypothetical protein